MNHDSLRTRKLLLHKSEVRKLEVASRQKGFTLIPTRLYFRRGQRSSASSPSPGQAVSGTKRATERKREADNEARPPSPAARRR